MVRIREAGPEALADLTPDRLAANAARQVELEEARKRFEYERQHLTVFVRTCITEQLFASGRARDERQIFEDLEKHSTRRDTAVLALRGLVERAQRHDLGDITSLTEGSRLASRSCSA